MFGTPLLDYILLWSVQGRLTLSFTNTSQIILLLVMIRVVYTPIVRNPFSQDDRSNKIFYQGKNFQFHRRALILILVLFIFTFKTLIFRYLKIYYYYYFYGLSDGIIYRQIHFSKNFHLFQLLLHCLFCLF